MMLTDLLKSRSFLFGANPIKKLLFFGSLLFFGLNGYGQDPTVSIERVSDGNENGPQSGQFRVSVAPLATFLGDNVEVLYSIVGTGTATPGSDFEPLSGQVTISYNILFGGSADVNIDVIDDDIIEENESIIIELLPDPGYLIGTQNSVTITIQDNDVAGFALSPNTLTTVENGPVQNFTVALTAEPYSEVVLNLVSGNTSEGTVSPPTLSFDATNWNVPQAVTVMPVADNIVDGPKTYDITVSVDAVASDDNFDAVGEQSVSVTNNDDDVAGFTLSPTTLSTIENGTVENFTVVLTAAPAGNVVLNVVSDNPLEGTISPSELTFTPGNWNAPQTVAVTPIDDNMVDGPQTYTITVSVDTATSDDNFDSLFDQTVTVTNEDDDSYTVTITATTPTATENPEVSGVFTVSLNAANITGSPIIVNYTVGGTADPGSDYTALSGTVSIAPGASSATITVAPINDSQVEADETVFLTLAAGTGYDIGTPSVATVNIISEDVPPLPVATITATTPTATENPMVSGTFTVSLNAANTTGSPITVNYTVGGTADPGSDYTALSGTVSIAPGAASATITVAPIDDSEVEADETVFLTLAAGTGYDIGTPSVATVNIISDDRASISINDISVNEYEGTATFDVTLSGSVPSGFVVTYITANGTATAGSDYASTSGTIPFVGNNGETHNIAVTILDDGLPESNETFFVDLGVSTSFVTLLKSRGVGTIVDNDNCVTQPNRVPGIPTTFCNNELSSGGVGQDLDEYVAASDIPSGFNLIWSRSDNFNNMGARVDGDGSTVFVAGTYYGFLSNGTCTSTPLPVNLARNEPPTIDSTTPATICGQGAATLRATASSSGGSIYWYASETAAQRLGEGLSFTTPIVEVTTTYYVEVLANGCTSVRVPVTLTVNDPIAVGTTTNGTACNGEGENTTLDLDTTRVGTGLATGVWSIVSPTSATITIDANNVVDFLGAPDGEYVFRLTTNTAVAPCTDESVEVTITVGSCAMDSDGDGLMDQDEIALGLDPNNPDTDGDGIDDGTEVGPDINNPLDSGGFGVIDALNPCFPNISVACNVDLGLEKTVDRANVSEGDQIVFTVTLINHSPIMVTNIRVNELIDPNITGFQYVSHSASKGVYDVARGVWELEEVLALEENVLTITATVEREGIFQNVVALVDSFPEDADSTNNTARVSVTVGPRSNDECGFLFNQISPNGDGTNDALRINCIDQYPNNFIQIYDRYGNEVFAARKYDNSWTGTGKNGKLPKGTYFYVLDLGDGTEVRKGWIQIIRQ